VSLEINFIHLKSTKIYCIFKTSYKIFILFFHKMMFIS